MKQIKITCPFCGNVHSFSITEEQYVKWKSGEELIQNIFPEIEPKWREMFITGMCPDCWDKCFE